MNHLAATISAVLLLTSLQRVAYAECEAGIGIKTPAGRLISNQCFDSKGVGTRRWFSLDGRRLVEDEYLSNDLALDTARLHWIYEGRSLQQTGCPKQIYLLDLSVAPPKVFAFGVTAACNQFHWASWGKKRSVIAIKDNVRFIYANGKLAAPAADNDLYSTIKPTMFDTPVEQLHPFARELPLPPSPPASP